MTRTGIRSLGWVVVVTLAGAVGLAAGRAGAGNNAALQEPPKAESGAFQLPPGWTAEDMQAMTEAGTPGKMHEHLAKSLGKWKGKTKMFMVPGLPAMESECTSTVTSLMGGRFIKTEMAGDIPGMGAFTGLALTGFDNVSKKFASTWIDNTGTGMMTGTGELAPDGKSLHWKFDYNCPMTKKPIVARQSETYSADGKSVTLEMFSPDPKTGKEFRSMEILFTR
jgi:hypothetical protein